MKPIFSVVASAVALFAVGGTALAEMPKAVGEGEGEVDIVAWPGYIERGETDKNYDWVTDFEKETGCKVNVKTAGTSDEMVTLMNEGGFDLVTASGDASLRLVAGKKVQPVNIDLIPSWKTVDDRAPERALAHGRRRALRRALSVGPERAACTTPTSSRRRRRAGTSSSRSRRCPTASRNKGRVQAYDGPIYIADAALYLMKKKPELGIKNPYELTEDQYEAAIDLLQAQQRAGRPLLARRHRAGRRLQERGRRRLRLLAVSGQSACRPTRSRSPRPFPRKARRAGPTPR